MAREFKKKRRKIISYVVFVWVKILVICKEEGIVVGLIKCVDKKRIIVMDMWLRLI